MQGSLIHMIILNVQDAEQYLFYCMSNRAVPKHTSSNRARAKEVWYRVPTLVKPTGLWGSNVLGHGTDGPV